MAELMEAVSKGSLEDVDRLLCEGHDPSFQEENDGVSVLMKASEMGNVDIVKKLLEYGSPWNAIDRQGNCAGDYAMIAENEEIINILVDAGIQAELILGASERALSKGKSESNEKYLKERVNYSEGNLIDFENKGVMMEWEKPLMEAHAHAICQEGTDVLNVGFGMGLVDESIQKRNPSSHTIIEAHPDVHAKMLSENWDKKKGVKIIHGRWQDVLPKLETYDGIFFDTYGEYYDDLREFHSHLPKLLRKGGTYSYFNGLCGNNAFFHVVCCHMAALELARFGLSTEYIPLPVKSCLNAETWTKVEGKYWNLDTYYLPLCRYAEGEETEGGKVLLSEL